MNNLVTKESLQKLIDTSSRKRQERIIGKALVHIFNRQTQAEKESNATSLNNSIGFASNDAYSGCLTAKAYIRNGGLLDWQLNRWVRKNKQGFSRITKYHRQLNEIAIRKAVAAETESRPESPAPVVSCAAAESLDDIKKVLGVGSVSNFQLEQQR